MEKLQSEQSEPALKTYHALQLRRNMQHYEYMKKRKGSGKSIAAAAKKMTEIVRAMLSGKQNFNAERMKGKYIPVTPADKAFSAMN